MMRGLIGSSKALLAGVIALTFGGAALIGTTDTPSESLWLTPEEAQTEKVLGSDEDFEMTLHVQGAPETTYELLVGYEGDAVGTCSNPVTPLLTDPEGKAAWTCTFDTAANETDGTLEGTVVYTVTDLASLEARISVRPAEVLETEPTPEPTPTEEEEEEEEDSALTKVNHGHCVSYWARESKAQGLRGSARGAFVSSIARDETAVSEKGAPGPDCRFQERLDEALEKQAAAPAKRPGKADGGSKKAGRGKKN